MMKGLSHFLLFALLTGCQSVESKIKELPTVGFEPGILYTIKVRPLLTEKFTLRVESSGTDVWLVAKNGTRSFIELSGLTLGGSRCAYNARSKQLLPPVQRKHIRSSYGWNAWTLLQQ